MDARDKKIRARIARRSLSFFLVTIIGRRSAGLTFSRCDCEIYMCDMNRTENPFVHSVKHFGLVLCDNCFHAFLHSHRHASLAREKHSARVRAHAHALARSEARLREMIVIQP